MICILGDIHFNASKDYFRKACEEFLTWFKNWERNSPGNSLILAGDLVHDSINGGIVIKYLELFTQYSNFDKIHVVVGNHDLKKVNNIPQLAYEFYKDKDNVEVYEEATEVLVEDKKVLMLPYFVGVNQYGMTMSEYYSTIYKNKAFKNDYDLVVGHFAGEDNSFPGAVDCVYNLDKLSGKICLGHIHTRNVNPGRYIGSVYAGRKNENDSTRAAWILGDTFLEEPLPIFIEYQTVLFPKPLPKSKALVPVYTILNCSSDAAAIEEYGNIYIRKTTKDNVDRGIKISDNLDRQFNSIKNMNIKELFKAFIDSQSDKPFSKEIIEKCNVALNKLI